MKTVVLLLTVSVLFLSLALNGQEAANQRTLQKIESLLDSCWKNRNSNPAKAKVFGLESISLALTIEDTRNLTTAYSFTGVAFRNLGYYEEALNYYSKGLQLALKLDTKIEQCYAYINIANLHLYLNKPDIAEEYLKTVEPIALEENKPSILGYLYLNKGRVQLALGNYDEALYNLEESLRIRKRMGKKNAQSVAIKYLGDVYFEKSNHRQAIRSYEESLKLMDKVKDKDLHSSTLNGLSLAYLRLNKIEEARNFAHQSLRIAQDFESLLRSKEAYKTLSQISKNSGDYQQAESYLNEVLDIRERLYTEDLRKQMERFSFTLKNRELDYQKEKQALKFEEEKRRVLMTTVSIASMVIILIILGVAIYLQRRKVSLQRVKLSLVENQNEILEKKVADRTQEIEMQHEEMKKLSRFKEELTHMIAHDLKNPINTILGLSHQHKNNLSSRKINEAGQTMLHMVANMLDIQKFEDANMKLNQTTFLVESMLKSITSQVSELLRAKSIRLKNQIPYGIALSADPDIVGRVFTNLLTNAIKFTEPGGAITLKSEIDPSENKVIFFVEDNGQGIEKEHLPHLFDKYWQAKAKKSGHIQSTGLGLTFCRLAIEAHEGSISVKSNLGHGTVFSFDLPMGKVSEGPRTNSNLSSEVTDNTVPKSMSLSAEEWQSVMPYLEKLGGIPLYDLGELTKVLDQIPSGSESLTNWKMCLSQAAYNWDERKFRQLISKDITISTKPT